MSKCPQTVGDHRAGVFALLDDHWPKHTLIHFGGEGVRLGGLAQAPVGGHGKGQRAAFSRPLHHLDNGPHALVLDNGVSPQYKGHRAGVNILRHTAEGC